MPRIQSLWHSLRAVACAHICRGFRQLNGETHQDLITESLCQASKAGERTAWQAFAANIAEKRATHAEAHLQRADLMNKVRSDHLINMALIGGVGDSQNVVV